MQTAQHPNSQKAYYHTVPVLVLTPFNECSLIRCLTNGLSFIVPSNELVYAESYALSVKKLKRGA